MKTFAKRAAAAAVVAIVAFVGTASEPKDAGAWCSPYNDCGYEDVYNYWYCSSGRCREVYDRYTIGCMGPTGIGHCQMTYPGSGIYVCGGPECYQYTWTMIVGTCTNGSACQYY
jgi:hypothetical protein